MHLSFKGLKGHKYCVRWLNLSNQRDSHGPQPAPAALLLVNTRKTLTKLELTP